MANIVKFLSSDKIKNEVDRILKEANNRGFYDYKSRTPIDLIIEELCSLRIMFDDLTKIQEGLLGLFDSEQNTIWIDYSLDYIANDKAYDEGRYNFTICHELGHFYLNHKSYSNNGLLMFHDESNPSSIRLEKQANIFATMLIMPEELFFKKWREYSMEHNDINCLISKMAGFFGSSKEATQIRLKELNLYKEV